MKMRSLVWRTMVTVGALVAVSLTVTLLVSLRVPESAELQITGYNTDKMLLTSLADFPHQVLLEITNYENKHFCAASIIHPKFLLTAAGCFLNDYQLLHVRALAGAHDPKRSDGNTEQIREVIRLIPHDNLHNQTLDNDIALLELNETLNFDTKYVRSVEMWDSKWPLPRKKSYKLHMYIVSK